MSNNVNIGLFEAIQDGNSTSFENILKRADNKKALLNTQNDDGNSVLHLTVIKADLQIFKILMHHYKLLDVKKKNIHGETPLEIALRILDTPSEIVKRLTALEIMHDTKPSIASVKRRKMGEINVLRKALQSADMPKVKQLIKNGINLNEVDKRGQTVLHSFALDLVCMAVRENSVWDLFSTGYLELFRYLVLETDIDVNKRTQTLNKTVIDIILDETFKHHYFRRTFYYDIARLLEPLVTKNGVDLSDDVKLYISIFRIFFVAIKGGSNKLVKYCIDTFYGIDQNPQMGIIVQKFSVLFNLTENCDRYILCLLLHDSYETVAHELGFLREQLDQGQPTMHGELLSICKILARTNYRFEERLEIFIEILLKLKQQGYHLERTHVIDTLAVSFVSENIPNERARRIHILFSSIFEHFHINFNNILIQVLERIPNFMWHILKNTYLDVRPIQMVLPFCTNVFYSVSTLFFTVLYNESFAMEHMDNSLLTLCEHQRLVFIEEEKRYALVPLSLQEIARIKIRREIHREARTNKAFVDTIMSLPSIPELIQKYIRFMGHL
uniref:CSON007466 protein n=1 Tax=Culicoides sonorensis TaxID=179676 RepID=A0A336LXH7_CULSO